jgi:hypothetical protein
MRLLLFVAKASDALHTLCTSGRHDSMKGWLACLWVHAVV